MKGIYVKGVVGKYYNVNMDCTSRRTESVRPRQMAMYLCHKHTELSWRQIGSVFGGVHYSTVISNHQRIVSLLCVHMELETEMEEIEDILKHENG